MGDRRSSAPPPPASLPWHLLPVLLRRWRAIGRAELGAFKSGSIAALICEFASAAEQIGERGLAELGTRWEQLQRIRELRAALRELADSRHLDLWGMRGAAELALERDEQRRDRRAA